MGRKRKTDARPSNLPEPAHGFDFIMPSIDHEQIQRELERDFRRLLMRLFAPRLYKRGKLRVDNLSRN